MARRDRSRMGRCWRQGKHSWRRLRSRARGTPRCASVGRSWSACDVLLGSAFACHQRTDVQRSSAPLAPDTCGCRTTSRTWTCTLRGQTGGTPSAGQIPSSPRSAVWAPAASESIRQMRALLEWHALNKW